MKQTLLSFLLLLPMVASAFSGEVEIDGIMYDISTKEQTAKVIGPSNPNISGDLVIPNSVIYEDRTCYVNSVGGFENCAGINSVSISEGVTEIKSRAFEGCEKLAYSSFCRLKYTIFKKNYEKHRGERRRQGGE